MWPNNTAKKPTHPVQTFGNMIEVIFGKPGKDSPAGARILQLQLSLSTSDVGFFLVVNMRNS